MTVQPYSVTDAAEAFVVALVERDYDAIARTLAPDVRMRALIPPGPIEVIGADAAAARFSSWFGGAESLELVQRGGEWVADRLHLFYRLRVKRPGESRKIVEQHLICTVSGRIVAFDLLCTGFRPESEMMG
jgi:hypothetical protein